jgi:hypothetical protein
MAATFGLGMRGTKSPARRLPGWRASRSCRRRDRGSTCTRQRLAADGSLESGRGQELVASGSKIRRGVTVAAFVSAAAVVVLPVAAVASVTWSTSFSPPKRSGYEVDGFAARSAVDVWAVGLRPGGRCQFQTLTLHWEGSTWNVIPSPSNTSVNSVLDGVTVTGTKGAWAVGTMGCPADQSRTLTEHWNGSGWSIVSSPNGSVTGNRFSSLQAVTAISSKNVWAVGGQAGIRNLMPATVPLTEHWNGTSWSIVPIPQAALGVLELVSATSASDIWAVGAGLQSGGTVAVHFNGSSWKLVPVPAPTGTSAGLSGVTALSATGAWAVGEAFPNAGGNGKILTDHWNGTSWRVVNAPPVGGPNALSGLSSIDAAPGTGVWALGFWVTDVAGNSVVLHWTGTAWKQETKPSGSSNLFRLAVLPNNKLFASDHGTISLGQFSGA